MAETTSSPPAPELGAAPAAETPAALPVVVKKYANRRLYNTETSSYITLDNLADMIRGGRDFVVYDAKSGDDITRGVLTQIIVEEESKGSSMLPTAFLRQLIGFYGGNLQGVVPRYLEHALASFTRQQQHIRQMLQHTLSPFLPAGVEEMNRQNMAIFDRAMSMWNPFLRGTELAPATTAEPAPAQAAPAPSPAEAEELERLRREVESLREQLDSAHQAVSAPPASEEVERLHRDVESLRQQLAVAHAAAVLPAATRPAPAEVPENILADPVETENGEVKPIRKLRPVRNKAAPLS